MKTSREILADRLSSAVIFVKRILCDYKIAGRVITLGKTEFKLNTILTF